VAYHRQQGVDTAIVRIFNTYVPACAHDGRAIRPSCARRCRTAAHRLRRGSQTRSFCYVDDLIRGIVSLAESDVHTPVNIGNPTSSRCSNWRRR